MKHVVHVHQQKIRRGEPAIIDRTYKGSTHHRRLEIPAGAVIVQSDTPDRCGARVWIEFDGPEIPAPPSCRLTEVEVT